jgi:hypothetical protein
MSSIESPDPQGTLASATSDSQPLSESSSPQPDLHSPDSESGERLSYKFQRLREKLRQSIASGELSGRLPGERKLARKFRVNAKTLSKALTDLAAEGLLDRSIGRGTFVKGTAASQEPQAADKWLIVCEPHQADSRVIRHLLAANPDAQCVVGTPPQRPSFLNSFKAAVIFSADTPEAFIRDLIVRNINVVVAGRQPSTYSTHAVLIDRSHGAAMIARDLMLAGHRQIAVLESPGRTELTNAIEQTARRYAPDVVIQTIVESKLSAPIEDGASALICDSAEAAEKIQKRLDELGVEVPRQVSLAAIGSSDGECPCTGYVVSSEQFGQAIISLLRDTVAKRPVTLFLSGQSVDRGTTGPTESVVDSSRMRYTSVSA